MPETTISQRSPLADYFDGQNISVQVHGGENNFTSSRLLQEMSSETQQWTWLNRICPDVPHQLANFWSDLVIRCWHQRCSDKIFRFQLVTTDSRRIGKVQSLNASPLTMEYDSMSTIMQSITSLSMRSTTGWSAGPLAGTFVTKWYA